MYATGIKTRQAPTIMDTTKRQKLDPQLTAATTTRLSTRSVVVTKRRNSVMASTATSKTADLRATSNRNIIKSKLTAPSTTKPMINNKSLRSLRPSRQSTTSTDTLTSSKLSMMSQKQLTIKESAVKATAKKPNGLPLLGAAVRPKLPSATSTINTRSTGSGRLWNRNNTASSLARTNNPKEESKTSENIVAPPTPPPAIEMGIQTQEEEILNHALLVGDIKYLNPSKHIVDAIEKLRKAEKTKQMLKATRKFEEHSERQEEHLTDLKEFLDKSYVTKRQRKFRDSFEEDRNTMDQLFNQEMPKTESITDIKARIKRKEQELLNLFDNVESTARLIINNK